MVCKRLMLCVVAGLAVVGTALATPSVRPQLVPPPDNMWTLDYLWKATLTTSGGPVTVYLYGYIEREGKKVVSGYSKNCLPLQDGTRRLVSQDVKGVRDLQYEKGYEAFTIRGGTPPAGVYKACVEVYDSASSQRLGVSCFEDTIRPVGAPRLMSPKDGAALPEAQNRPLFTWTRPMPAPKGVVTYDLTIVEVLPMQTAFMAMRDNKPWFQKTGIATTNFKYSGTPFEKGKKYAWQVKTAGGTSEVWDFEVVLLVIPPGCNRPDPDFCPGNWFVNGNFESLVGNPHADDDQDIDSAFGWSRIWSNASYQYGDLYCEFDNVGPFSSPNGPPIPSAGGQPGAWAGCWIDSRHTPQWGFREGMFDPLTAAIPRTTADCWYTFTFDMAPFYELYPDPSRTAEIGIYGLDNPSGLSNIVFATNNSPSNLDIFPGQVVQLVTVPVTGPRTNQMTKQTVSFNSKDFPPNISEITHLLITHSDDSLSMTGCWYVAFDNFCLQTGLPGRDTSAYCCPGDNLVENGNFEDGNTDFISSYAYEAQKNADAVMPGEYSVVTSDEAPAICDQWVAKDHSACTEGYSGDQFMVVNGRTQQSYSGGPYPGAVIWQQTVTTQKDSIYKFCAYFKWLKQCCFDRKPRVKIIIGPVTSTTWKAIGTGDDECEWRLIGKQFTATGTAVTIKIVLDERRVSDGSDVAIDDISVHRLHPVPEASVNFWLQDVPDPNDPGSRNITATQAPPPFDGAFDQGGECDYSWEVGEVNKTDPEGPYISNTAVLGNPPEWQTYPNANSFPGYDGTSTLNPAVTPGRFASGKAYRIVYAVTCSCATKRWIAKSFYWTSGAKGSELVVKDLSNYRPSKGVWKGDAEPPDEE